MSDASLSNNPLSQYFRGQPIYIKLPSCGFYCEKDDIETNATGEIAVYPMTTGDELLLKSPDALINGESVAKIIQSCAPAIKNIYNLPAPDVEALLLAIKQATYDKQMDFETTCPKCDKINEFSVSIEWALSTMDHLKPDAETKLRNGLKVKIKPYTYSSSVKLAVMAFNEAKFLQMLTEDDLTDEEKAGKASESYTKAVRLTVDLMAESIIGVYDKDNKLITNDPTHILEWVRNLNRGDAKTIEEAVKNLTDTGVAKEIEIKCDGCGHEWRTKIEYDPSNFFE
jgi:phage FluMu protein Com